MTSESMQIANDGRGSVWPPPRPAPSRLAILRVEVRDEMLGILREPTALFFSVLMPVMFFALFVSLFGSQAADIPGAELDVTVGTTMLATFGTYGVLVAAMMTPAIGLAESRERGWLRVLKTSPVPVPVTLSAKVVATLPYCLGILTAMTATAAALGVLEITVAQWLLLAGGLVVGTLPFALLGLAIGSLASGNATTAILNAIIIPAAVASGLWFPLSQLPDWVASVATFLPTYHLSQLALAPLKGGGDWPLHVAALLLFTALAGIAATVAYRRSRL